MVNGTESAFDSTDVFSFNSLRNLRRIGDNFWYSSLQQMALIKLTNQPPSGIKNLPTAEGLIIYPNPAKNEWHINSTKNGTYNLFSVDGKNLAGGKLDAGKLLHLEANNLPAGNYFFTRTDESGVKTTVMLVKE